MKKRILTLLLAVAMLLSGCASLLERSYTVVEPYTDRYRDTTAEDTLRAENYQDLVNTLLMLVEQRAADGVIRYYGKSEMDAYMSAVAARQEVLQETVLGSYLLQDLVLDFSGGEEHSTLSFTLSYREEAENPDNLMVLSDTQSLVDLLRVSVREEHSLLTARFFEETARADVESAVESFWLELQQESAATESEPPTAEGPSTEPEIPATEPTLPEGETTTQPTPPEGETTTETETPPQDAETVSEPAEPCPWTIRFYPDREAAEIVEILLTEG